MELEEEKAVDRVTSNSGFIFRPIGTCKDACGDSNTDGDIIGNTMVNACLYREFLPTFWPAYNKWKPLPVHIFILLTPSLTMSRSRASIIFLK